MPSSSDAAQVYETYYAYGGNSYSRDESWSNFFDAVADQIVADIRPVRVLDVGCARGLLVERLRARGAEAYGIDASESLLQQVPLEIRPYCRLGSVLETLSGHYDLIVCLEVLEHLPPTEAGRAIANLCQYSDDILFSSTPFGFIEITQLNVQPPDYWAAHFARHGFFHDVDYDASYLAPWALRFRRGRGDAIGPVVAAYERQVWRLTQETAARRELLLEQAHSLALRADQIELMRAKADQYDEVVRALEQQNARWAQLEASMGGRLLKRLQNLRAWAAPPRSLRDQLLEDLVQRVVVRGRITPGSATHLIQVEPITERAPVLPHTATVDIVVCVHNALDDVRRCLDSVVEHTTPPYALILVDDGSDAPTRDFLVEFVAQRPAALIRNEAARGYGHAANQGLRASTADYVILLNSDTVVTAEWIDRLVACGESDDRIGLVGPLSNTASWQSIPEIEENGDWATNPLPPGVTIDQMGLWVAQSAARLYPPLPFLNGFCYGIKRTVINQIGYLDEENFGAGYGEEDDFTLRTRQAGYRVAIADDVYIYHAQSRSYSNETRHALSERAGQALVRKHTRAFIDQGVTICQNDPVMMGVRTRSGLLPERDAVIRLGQEHYNGKRLLFVLPIREPGGGGNVVIDEAMLMRRMGVEVCLFNLPEHQARFEQAYPQLKLPVIYGSYEQLPALCTGFDAVIATFNVSVEALRPLAQQAQHPVLGYYIQGFEPYMYTPGTPEYQRALNSYGRLPQLVRFTKTEWTRQEVLKHTGVDSQPIGISVNIDLFRPRPPLDPVWPDRPVRVAAMVRPAAPYREPKMTMEVLRHLVRRSGSNVEAVIFGVAENDPGFNDLPRDFAYTSAGVLSQRQVARLLNEVDVFVDFSSHQAMGLTALEAMACGAAVIVPAHGGATSFAHHGENSLVVDTTSRHACESALMQLVNDHDLRRRLQQHALRDVCAFYPERPAYHILEVLFGGKWA